MTTPHETLEQYFPQTDGKPESPDKLSPSTVKYQTRFLEEPLLSQMLEVARDQAGLAAVTITDTKEAGSAHAAIADLENTTFERNLENTTRGMINPRVSYNPESYRSTAETKVGEGKTYVLFRVSDPSAFQSFLSACRERIDSTIF